VKWERVKGRTAHVGAGDRHLAVPLAWAVLLLFHPAVGGPVYDSLVDDRSAFLVVHLGMLVFIGLIGAALYLLVRDLPGTAARVARYAIGPFILSTPRGRRCSVSLPM
jgi:hypothetical protein